MSEQHVFTARRNYNRWVANQTLEDYALRFTAKRARRWSIAKVSNTALGSISFLALEAIGAAITLHYGFVNAAMAILAVSVVIFITGLPISYYAAKYGVDIDLLSRGAGFGYIGSTITSLIYASFTFIFFALEAAILSSALEILFGLPLPLGYLLSSLIVIPLTTHGITFISRFQLWSQPLFLILQILPFVFILQHEWNAVSDWTNYQGTAQNKGEGFNLLFFGAASAVLFSLIAQIGEQVDFLRFLPEKKPDKQWQWWFGLLSAGPGWIIVGAIKILAGSFLAVLAVKHFVPVELASDPTQMYLVAFSFITNNEMAALAIAGIFVIICQLKINVTNAYAGSIAWSNFFSRLTHSHPGRVVWLVFNVMIALVLMQMGVYQALESILEMYSIVAVTWVGVLFADLVINKPLGLSPKHIEFKRAHLFDINPVGFGAMIIASAVGICSYIGLYGEQCQALSSYLSLASSILITPLIAWLTKGKYYIARQPDSIDIKELIKHNDCTMVQCKICQNEYELEDVTTCPAYGGTICSLCCSIDSRCHDQCKKGARFGEQLAGFVAAILPNSIAARMDNRLLQFSGLLVLISGIIATMFLMVYHQTVIDQNNQTPLSTTMIQVYVLLMIIIGILIWLYVLANESRQMALEESQRQTNLLSDEIKAHEITDLALQQAKEVAEAANQAKSRYLTGISHELRSPLNSILGYAQLLERDQQLPEAYQHKVGLIRSSGNHLADLIEGLLDISRIEAGKMEIQKDHVHFTALLDELAEMFSAQAAEKNLAFRFAAINKLPAAVVADEKHLRQILINLLSNAVKYTDQGSITFSVRYRNQVAEFTVIDTGCGISENDLQSIYEPFNRLQQQGRLKSSGTGLGLTISKFLTEIMGGDLTASSKPGVGSTFKLSLMLPVSACDISCHEHDRQVISYAGPQKTIMLVDDKNSHRKLVREILEPLGFNVIETEDAFHCLDLLESHDIDLFLLDISMPGLSGWQLLKELRINELTQPIIMVSADAFQHAPDINFVQEKIRPNDDYITKPIRDQELLAKISQQLEINWIYEDEISRS